MLKAGSTPLIVFALLVSTAGLADDRAIPVRASEPLAADTLSLENLLEKLPNVTGWQSDYPLEATSYSDDRPSIITRLHFEDAGRLSRVARLRSLSLLTVAEFGQSRLFVGVNDKGFLGLHFNVFTGRDAERYLEIARMPYLKTNGVYAGVEP